MNATPTECVGKRTWMAPVAVLAYVIVAHTLDTFWTTWLGRRWRLGNGFDMCQFLLWLVIPLALTRGRLDWGCFGFRRWRPYDWLILAVLVVGGALCVAAVHWIPSLRGVYPTLRHLPSVVKRAYLFSTLTWTASWLIGWEFLHRYLLLRHMAARWPRYGWLAVPIVEGVYHLQKPLPEACAMTIFSLLATPWALQRRNVLLPFLAHLAVEIELLAFMLFI